MPAEKKGLVMVYTGEGKGKTTAAVGQAIRALGHGYSVYMIHFMKGRDYGEFLAMAGMPRLTVDRAGRDLFVDPENPDPVDVELAREGLARARRTMLGGEYDLLVLDEVNVAVDFGLISEEELLKIIDEKPPGVDLILTGRGATPELARRADMVSEVLAIKHHYDNGVNGRRGIEY